MHYNLHPMKKTIYFLTLIGFFFCIAESCSIEDLIPSKVDFTFKVDTHGKVIFTNTSKNAAKFHWDFGNNVTSTAFDTTIQYIKNTTYTVSLIATSANGNSNTIQKKILVETVRIPTRMSFEGTFSLGKLSFVDGEEGVRFWNYYSNYSTYITFLNKNSRNGITFYNTSNRIYDSHNEFNNFAKHNFIKGYNKTVAFNDFIFSKQPGMNISYYFGNQSSDSDKPQKIEIIEILKKDYKICYCDTESFWVKYKIEAEDLNGILTVRYDNPCCLR